VFVMCFNWILSVLSLCKHSVGTGYGVVAGAIVPITVFSYSLPLLFCTVVVNTRKSATAGERRRTYARIITHFNIFLHFLLRVWAVIYALIFLFRTEKELSNKVEKGS